MWTRNPPRRWLRVPMPLVPQLAAKLSDDVVQTHSAHYRNLKGAQTRSCSWAVLVEDPTE
jgi:hypothetical protein